MAALEFDIRDEAMRDCFPAHGWAINTGGYKLLWLPAIRFVRSMHAVRKAKMVSPPTGGGLQDAWRLEHTLKNLVATLRELHRFRRLVSELPVGREEWPANVQSTDNILTLTPVFVDAAYVYLRRLGNDIPTAFRHLLFTNPDSAPKKLHDLRKRVLDANELSTLGPICDVGVLAQCLEAHTAWLSELRGTFKVDQTTKKGIRDALEHRASVISVQYSIVENELWQLCVHPTGPQVASDVWRGELVGRIDVLVADVCQLLTGFCRAVDHFERYEFGLAPVGDSVVLTGAFDDVVGFWPQVVPVLANE